MIQRAGTAERINAVFNDPSVRPFVADAALGDLDFSDVVAQDRHYCLFGQHGAVVALEALHGFYEIHLGVTELGRGEWAKEFTFEAIRFMFGQTPAVELLARIAKPQPIVTALLIAVGARKLFSLDTGFQRNGEEVGMTAFAMGLEDWRLADRQYLAMRGRDWFGESAKLGADYLGMVGLMWEGGQSAKALAWLRRWMWLVRHQLYQADDKGLMKWLVEEHD